MAVLGKLGDLLNKDVGALVKDAGKVLNTDVGTLAKGAGKVLNADLGDLLRSSAPTEGAAPAEVAAPTEKVAKVPDKKPAPAIDPDATTIMAAMPELAAAPTPSVAPSAAPAPVERAFDPDATLQINSPPPLAVPSSVESAAAPRLTDELVSRARRTVPTGTSLINLLPYAVGEFERPHATPAGELTSDPVSAIYRGGGETIAVKLVLCWDGDEAIERLDEVRTQAGDNLRVAADRSWVLGQTAQGIVYAWTRDSYSFSATSPKGLGSLAKFLLAFPY